MALWTGERAGGEGGGVVHHSDAGAQYTAIRYCDRLSDAGAVASSGSIGDSFDNAMAESVIGLSKAECARLDGPWRTVKDRERGTLSWVHWFNRVRLRSAIGYERPAAFGAAYYLHNPSRPAVGRTQPPLKPGRFNL